MSSSIDRSLSQEEFPRLPGQAFAEELDLPLEQEMSRDLITYNVDKEVMVMAAKVQYISQEEFMEKQLADALTRSAAVLMPKKLYLEKQDKVPSKNTGWPKAVGKLCGGAPQPDKEQDQILAMMDQYSEANGGDVPGVERVTLVAGDPSQDCPSCLIAMPLEEELAMVFLPYQKEKEVLLSITKHLSMAQVEEKKNSSTSKMMEVI